MTKTKRQLKKAAPANFNAAKFIAAAGSKSAAIRKLDAMGYERGDIAQLLGIIYQHVRNVLITPVKTEKQPASTAAQYSDEEIDATLGITK